MVRFKFKKGPCFLAVLSLFCSISSTCNHDPCRGINSKNTTATIMHCVQSGPKENILAIPEVRDYLSRHKVYISLTTSPQRITKILPVLQTLDLELVTNILLVLPMKFSRDNSSYLIPYEIESFSEKLKILRIETDLGPITKLLPAIVYVNNTPENQEAKIKFLDTIQNPESPDPKAIVITIDDDTAYYHGSISQLIKYAILKDAVVGGNGKDLSIFNLERAYWPEKIEPQPKCRTTDVSNCDLIEGWAAIAYKAGYVDVKLMKDLNALGKYCKSADDLVISFVLASHKPRPILKFMISNDYIYAPVQFYFGFEEDALHRGAGSGSQSSQAHNQNYPLCLKEINNKNS